MFGNNKVKVKVKVSWSITAKIVDQLAEGVHLKAPSGLIAYHLLCACEPPIRREDKL